MFDIGFVELLVLAGLGLIVLGPKRLPEVAAQLGRWVGQARRMSRTLMYQLRQEVNLDEPRPFASRRPAGTADSKAGSRQASDKNKDAGNDGAESSGTAENGQDKTSE